MAQYEKIEEYARSKKEEYTKEQYINAKHDLKRRAHDLHEWKQNRKLQRREELGLSQWSVDSKVYGMKWEYRHRHLAYCLLKGRVYHEIERRCEYEPEWRVIIKYIDEYLAFSSDE